MSLLFKLSYGLYALSAREGDKDNACIVNTVMQQTNTPEQISVTVNKSNYTHGMIIRTGKCAVSILSTNTTFDTIKHFGMQSGANADKFASINYTTAQSGIKVITDGSLGYFDLNVVRSVDMGTHTLFVCTIADSVTLGEGEPLTYAYYHANIKPKPQETASGSTEKWICNICGYVHEGPLPPDFICPLCKHGVADFTRQ